MQEGKPPISKYIKHNSNKVILQIIIIIVEIIWQKFSSNNNKNILYRKRKGLIFSLQLYIF